MPDAAPSLDAATRNALAGLADIVAPPPVSWLPQTWGWAALGLLLLAAAAWAYVRRRRWREANRYREEALRELAALEAGLEATGDDGKARALVALPPLLKRVALAAWPRAEVASLSGSAWVDFLRAHGAAALPDPTARLLDDAEYRSQRALAAVTIDEARACVRAARAWIEGHRAAA